MEHGLTWNDQVESVFFGMSADQYEVSSVFRTRLRTSYLGQKFDYILDDKPLLFCWAAIVSRVKAGTLTKTATRKAILMSGLVLGRKTSVVRSRS